jgi:hypothetical protein
LDAGIGVEHVTLDLRNTDDDILRLAEKRMLKIVETAARADDDGVVPG